MLIYHTPSFSPFLLVVRNLAHHLDGEGGISVGDGCFHVVVAPLSVLPKIAETISDVQVTPESATVGVKDQGGTNGHVYHLFFLPPSNPSW